MKEHRILEAKKLKWIEFPEAHKLQKKLFNLLEPIETHRMPNLLIVGDSNNGKTLSLKKFIKSNPPFLNEDNKLEIPVLYVESPAEPNEKRLYDEILNGLNAPFKPSEKIESKLYRVRYFLKETNVKILVIDEIHNVVSGGTANKQRIFLNVIKNLSNTLNISMVCAGTKEALNAFNTDSQLSNRFEPFIINRWKYNTDFLRLLSSFESLLNLHEKSNLHEKEISFKIFTLSDGLIGEITKILELSAVKAIELEIEKITNSILDQIDYVSPTERKKLLRQMI